MHSLPIAFYKLEFARNPKRMQKKHASDLSPYSPELKPFEPLTMQIAVIANHTNLLATPHSRKPA
jgi:hypothetical protein